jgi:4-hydroxy-3-methylbut-2-en-1-yl diphosphate reductase
MEVIIDKRSGFCYGVLNAISLAEKYLHEYGTLFCLGDIVHNNKEVERLSNLGLIVINHTDLKDLYNTRVLFRAHGEPPQTYQIALENNIEIIDASCPVVLKLQNRVEKSYRQMLREEGQVVIFGKKGHAEVVGLLGQTNGQAIVIEDDFANIDQINFSKPVVVYSQTTQDKESYFRLKELISSKYKSIHCSPECAPEFKAHNTICGQVSSRGPQLAEFAARHDVVIFVSGKKSSNGRYLFDICSKNNPASHFISDREELQKEWFAGAATTGVCGATSTPMWLMEEIAAEIKRLGE